MTEGRKASRGKLRYSLVVPEAHQELVKVLTFGAEKYSEYHSCTCNASPHTPTCLSHVRFKDGAQNWRYVTDPIEQYTDALFRHLEKYRMGVELDEESGIHHLAHAAACLHFLLSLELEKASLDSEEDDE